MAFISALNVLLIPDFGLEGAAAATTLTVVYVCFVLFPIAKFRLGLHPFIIGTPGISQHVPSEAI